MSAQPPPPEGPTAHAEKIARLRSQLLESLYEACAVPAQVRTPLELADALLLGAMGPLGISRGAVFLRNGPRLRAQAQRGLSTQVTGSHSYYPGTLARPPGPVPPANCALGNILEAHRLVQSIPLRIGDRPVGLLALGESGHVDEGDGEKARYLVAIAAIYAAAISDALDRERLASSNRTLERRTRELGTLFEIGRELSSSLEEKRVLDVLAFSVMGNLGLPRAAVFLHDNTRYTPHIQKGLAFGEEAIAGTIELLGEVDADGNLPEAPELLAFGVAGVVPMVAPSGLKGGMALGERLDGQPLLATDLKFAATAGNTALSAVENARLFRLAIEKERIERELSIAREIQQQLCPHSLPDLPGLEIAARTYPSREIGGDLYEAVQVGDREAVFALADVTGKGVPAALLAASIQSAIRTMARAGLSLVDLAERLNDLVCEQTDSRHFASCFLARYRAADRQLITCSAGHDPTLLFRKDGGECTQLTTGGLILGVIPGASYEIETHTLEPGDRLIAYSDGITESLRDGSDDQELGLSGLTEIIRSIDPAESGERCLDLLTEAVNRFTGGSEASDDRTLVLLSGQ